MVLIYITGFLNNNIGQWPWPPRVEYTIHMCADDKILHT